MSAISSNRMKALSSNFEIVCIVSTIALIGDMVWLTHDILVNGMSLWYAIVGSGLITGIIGTITVLIRHYRTSVYWLNKETLKEKLKIAKARLRHSK